VAPYARRALSLAQARALTELARREFDELVGERRVACQYEEGDLAEDVDVWGSG